MNNTKRYSLCLQLFASEGVSEAGETGGYSDADAGQAFGAENEHGDTDTEFSELIEGKFKEQFTKKTQAIIDKRFKQTKELEEYKNRTSPLLKQLAEKYGVEDGNADVLFERLENERLKSENADLGNRDALRERIGGWLSEGEALKETYPEFDLKNELHADKTFAQLLCNGIPVKTAYEVVHQQEILGGAMAYTAGKVREQVVRGIEAKGKRPVENGISGEAGIVTKTDVNSLTSQDILKILKQVENGVNVTF